MLTQIYNYAVAHPYLVAAALTVILKGLLNYATDHPADARGWRKPLLIALDVLSFVHSKNSTQRGLKLPGSTSPRQPGRLVK